MENEKLHALSITNKELKLDDFKINGVKDYTLVSSAAGTTELTLKITIKDLKVSLD